MWVLGSTRNVFQRDSVCLEQLNDLLASKYSKNKTRLKLLGNCMRIKGKSVKQRAAFWPGIFPGMEFLDFGPKTHELSVKSVILIRTKWDLTGWQVRTVPAYYLLIKIARRQNYVSVDICVISLNKGNLLQQCSHHMSLCYILLWVGKCSL